MGFRLFSALFTGKSEHETAHFLEKKNGGDVLWILAQLPMKEILGKEIFETMSGDLEKTLFLDKNGENTEEDFEIALKEANTNLRHLLGDAAETVLRSGGFLIAFLHNNSLYLSSFGQGEVFLLRSGTLLEISEGLTPSTLDGDFFANVSNGDLQDGDRLLLSFVRLRRLMTERQLAEVLDDGVSESMEILISATEPTESGGMFLINAKGNDVLPLRGLENSFVSRRNWFREAQLRLMSRYRRILRHSPLQTVHIFLAVAGVIALFLVVFFFQSFFQKDTVLKNDTYDTFIEQIDQKFSTVETRRIENKIKIANELLSEIETTAQAMIDDRVRSQMANKILEMVQKKREDINNIKTVSRPEVLASLTEAKENILARGLVALGGTLFAFDPNSLVSILPADEANVKYLGSLVNNDEVVLSASFPTKRSLLFLTKSGSVLEWSDNNSFSADTADEVWHSAVDIATYSKYAYFLDPTENQIWKYERRDSGFTTAESWVTDGSDLSKAVSFAIDGNVFVLTSEGEIQKFYQGKKVPFNMVGLPQERVTGDVLHISADQSRMLVLDRQQKRVFVFTYGDNELRYDRQIVFRDFQEGDNGAIRDIYATGDTLYVLGEKNIYVERF